MRILITGAEGFVGRVLSERFARCGAEVLGTSRDGSAGVLLDLLGERRRAQELFADFRPDAVLHLAAISAVGAAESDPATAYTVNVEGTRLLMEASLSLAAPPHFVYVSSCAVYGVVPPSRQPIREDFEPLPVNVYGVTKLVAEAVLRAAPELRWTILRPFNHTGPGQSADFALSGFARQIARIEAREEAPQLRVGNLAVERDFLDVRDVADAYWRAANLRGEGRTYNVCSGSAPPLREHLDALLALASVRIETVVDGERMRKADVTRLAGDPRAFCAATGWKPAIPMRQTLRDLLEYWRAEVAKVRGAP
ncbi:MAG: NAD-dependent epimerase/dehydratase family protein [Planctomycetes bacterium]|nr:NAD-dependent epimerase/dehydratase family protein [Planctomycetota bacterium]